MESLILDQDHTPTTSSELSNQPERTVNYEAGKKLDDFRNYDNSDRQSTVVNHYTMMRKYQTLAFAHKMAEKWHGFNHAKLTIREAFKLLEGYVDSSDPDTELPNMEHML